MNNSVAIRAHRAEVANRIHVPDSLHVGKRTDVMDVDQISRGAAVDCMQRLVADGTSRTVMAKAIPACTRVTLPYSLYHIPFRPFLIGWGAAGRAPHERALRLAARSGILPESPKRRHHGRAHDIGGVAQRATLMCPVCEHIAPPAP